MVMGQLPDEIWTQVVEAGVLRGVLDHRDLCSISISCSRLCRLSGLNSVWSPLWEKDFPKDAQKAKVEVASCGPPVDFKSMYRSRFEKVRAAKLAAHKRRVLRVQSHAAALEKECKDLESLIHAERKTLSATITELGNLERARQASVALRLWQPQIVRTMQQQVVEQQPVNVEARQQSLKMEISICKERIERFDKNIRQKRALIEKMRRELESLTYNPVQDAQGSDCVRGSTDTNSKKTKVGKSKSTSAIWSQIYL